MRFIHACLLGLAAGSPLHHVSTHDSYSYFKPLFEGLEISSPAEALPILMSRTAEAIEKFTNSKYFVNTCLPEKPDPTPYGNVILGQKIAATGDSVVFEVTLDTEDKKFIAKYGMDCRDLIKTEMRDSNLLKFEFQILVALQQLNISPRVYFLSPASPISDLRSEKLKSNLFTKLGARCQNATVRMLLMDKAGPELKDYLMWFRKKTIEQPEQYPPKDYLLAVLTFASKWLVLLEKLHSVGLLHGDVHAKNVLLKEPMEMNSYDWRTAELVLIDFGFASTNKENNPSSSVVDLMSLNAMMLSPWQINGSPVGKRDDVYRLFESLAVLLADGRIDEGINMRLQRMYPEFVSKYGQTRDASKNAILAVCAEYKTSGNLFGRDRRLKSQCCLGMGLSHVQIQVVQGLLEGLMFEVKEPSSPGSEPRYEVIQTLLELTMQTVRAF